MRMALKKKKKKKNWKAYIFPFRETTYTRYNRYCLTYQLESIYDEI